MNKYIPARPESASVLTCCATLSASSPGAGGGQLAEAVMADAPTPILDERSDPAFRSHSLFQVKRQFVGSPVALTCWQCGARGNPPACGHVPRDAELTPEHGRVVSDPMEQRQNGIWQRIRLWLGL